MEERHEFIYVKFSTRYILFQSILQDEMSHIFIIIMEIQYYELSNINLLLFL